MPNAPKLIYSNIIQVWKKGWWDIWGLNIGVSAITFWWYLASFEAIINSIIHKMISIVFK